MFVATNSKNTKSDLTTVVQTTTSTGSNTSTTDTTTSTGSNTSTTDTTTTTSSTTTTTTSSTTTETVTTTFDSCNSISWNGTGVRVAGDGTAGSGSSQLTEPRCVYVDANDTVYVCDTSNSRIQKWLKGATSGTTVAGGSSGTGSNQLNKPLGVTFDSNGYMYVADTDNNRVQKFPPGSTTGTTIAGSSSGSSGNSNSLLTRPTTVIVDNTGNVYITDQDNGRVMKYASGATSGTNAFVSGSSGKTYGLAFRNGSQTEVFLSNDANLNTKLWTLGVSTASATFGSGSFSKAKSIAVDWYGNVLVADDGYNQVNLFCAGTWTRRVVVGGSSGTTPSLTESTGIAFDSNMNLYVTSKSPPAVYKYTRI